MRFSPVVDPELYAYAIKSSKHAIDFVSEFTASKVINGEVALGDWMAQCCQPNVLPSKGAIQTVMRLAGKGEFEKWCEAMDWKCSSP